jgi:hypothetical protein
MVMRDLRAEWMTTRGWKKPPQPQPKPEKVIKPPSAAYQKRAPGDKARKHAKQERVTEQDVPHLFRWLQKGTEQLPARATWDEVKQSIPLILRTGHNKMRQDTKKLAKIESVTKQLVEALELGASVDTAAAYAGIKPTEFREWLALGHTRPRSIYAAFLGLIQAAIAKCDIQDLRVITKAADGGEWKAAIERLKLRGFGNQALTEKKPVQVKIVNYNFATPPKKVIAQVLDLDTLEYAKEEPHAIEYREESDELQEECDDTDARGQISSKASVGRRVLEAEGGETPSETGEKEITVSNG